jgi:hypothetical protein
MREAERVLKLRKAQIVAVQMPMAKADMLSPTTAFLTR